MSQIDASESAATVPTPDMEFENLSDISLERLCASNYATLKRIFLQAPDEF